jgi:peptidoglycan/xylan/chitin deacetylase (PgdA/CDA1 family)
MLLQIKSDILPVAFTWDDNARRHITHIAPLFIAQGLRCTFYINPGEPGFDKTYQSSYAELARQGFEIGSHSDTHQFMTTLSEREFDCELSKGASKIQQLTNQYPLSFAFPNHDYTTAMVSRAKQYHIETRNTLRNSTRCSIKTKSRVEDLCAAIDNAVTNKINLIFSGHSIITQAEIDAVTGGEGYEPMLTEVLEDLLHRISHQENIHVKTFAQLALREWCIVNGEQKEADSWDISDEVLQVLARYNITKDNIESYL